MMLLRGGDGFACLEAVRGMQHLICDLSHVLRGLCGHRYYVDMGGKRPVLQGFADRHVHIIIEGFRGSLQRLGDEYHRS